MRQEKRIINHRRKINNDGTDKLNRRKNKQTKKGGEKDTHNARRGKKWQKTGGKKCHGKKRYKSREKRTRLEI